MKNFKTSKIYSIVLAIVISALSVMTLIGSIISTASAEETTDTYAIIDGRGDGGSGAYTDPYYENDWNGSIKSENYIGIVAGGDLHVEFTVDPRNVSGNDDVLIDCWMYYYSSVLGRKMDVKADYFEAWVQFYDEDGIYLDGMKPGHMPFLPDKAKGRMQAKSGLKNVEGVNMVIFAKKGTKTIAIYYRFGIETPNFV